MPCNPSTGDAEIVSEKHAGQIVDSRVNERPYMNTRW